MVLENWFWFLVAKLPPSEIIMADEIDAISDACFIAVSNI